MPHVISRQKPGLGVIVAKDASIILNIADSDKILDNAFLPEFDVTRLGFTQ